MEAQIWMGFAHKAGQVVKQDAQLSAQWFLLAANQGDAVSQYETGKAYEMGMGLDANIAEAMFWYEKAAEQNHIVSQYLTAGYLEGRGVVQDDKASFIWLRMAADHDHKPAARYLGDLLRTGEEPRWILLLQPATT